MTVDLFQEFIENIFNPYLIEKPVIRFVDGHINLKVSVLSKEVQIILYLLPPRTTYLLQPADPDKNIKWQGM